MSMSSFDAAPDEKPAVDPMGPPEIAIIGGGPAGLYAAARLTGPDIGIDPKYITIYEPREEYTRPGFILRSTFSELNTKLKGLDQYLEDCKDKEKYKKMLAPPGTPRAPGHIKDYERLLKYVVLSKGIKIKPYSLEDISDDGIELSDKKGNRYKEKPGLIIEASGPARIVIKKINARAKEKPFTIERFSDNPILVHFLAYVKISPEDAELLKYKDSTEINPLWLEEAQKKFKWPYSVAPKLQFHSFDKDKYCIYLETPGNLTSDQYGPWLSAVLKLYTEDYKDVPFSLLGPPRKYSKKPRFLPFEYDPLKVSPGVNKSKTFITVVVGDSLFAPHYQQGVGITSAEKMVDTFSASLHVEKGRAVAFNSNKYKKDLTLLISFAEEAVNGLLKKRKKELGIPILDEKTIDRPSEIKEIALLSCPSPVGELWVCEQESKRVILQKYLIGKDGQSNVQQINQLRDIVLAQYPIYNVLNQCPLFMKIYGTVTVNGGPDGDFYGITREHLDDYETFAKVQERYQENKQFLEPQTIISLLLDYLEALAFLHAAGLSSRLNNIIVNKDFHLKLVPHEMIGTCEKKPEQEDILEIHSIFSSLLSVCDKKNENVHTLFIKIKSGEFKTIEDCFLYIKQEFSLPQEGPRKYAIRINQVSPSIERAKGLHQKYLSIEKKMEEKPLIRPEATGPKLRQQAYRLMGECTQRHRQKLGQPLFLTDRPNIDVETVRISLEKKTPDEIVPGLFLGDLPHAELPIKDLSHENIGQHFEDTFNFIENALKNGEKVLLHCDAEPSRGPTIVAAYLIRKYCLSATGAINHIKAKRPCVNTGHFTKQLEQYADTPRQQLLREFLANHQASYRSGCTHGLFSITRLTAYTKDEQGRDKGLDINKIIDHAKQLTWFRNKNRTREVLEAMKIMDKNGTIINGLFKA